MLRSSFDKGNRRLSIFHELYILAFARGFIRESNSITEREKHPVKMIKKIATTRNVDGQAQVIRIN